MRAIDIIEHKRDGKEMTPEQIDFLMRGMLNGEIENYQVTAWLMAVYLRGMTAQETANLARAMMNSGETYDWASLGKPGNIVDKHSTGGVGDKVSIVLGPLVAAMGMTDPMISGRGLGHTGGTLDKLEAIPGFNIHPTREQFAAQLAEIGNVMAGQSETFVPADKLLYSLRDVTGTVSSIPLICGSILSKKAAAGVQALLLDVKTGTGAFMQTLPEAQALAAALKSTGAALGMNVRIIITDMSQPLGQMVGNAHEIIECIDIMHGAGPQDLRTLIIEQAAEMLMTAQLPQHASTTIEQAREFAKETLDNGDAWRAFLAMCAAQGADTTALHDPWNRLDIAPETTELIGDCDGYLTGTNCKDIGIAAAILGAGRLRAADTIDYGVGIQILVRIGDTIKSGQPLARVWHRTNQDITPTLTQLRNALIITNTSVTPPTLIYQTM